MQNPDDLRDFLEEISSLPDFFGHDPICVNTRGGGNITPLHVSAIRGDERIAQMLIDSGAEIDAKGEDDFTPLHDAVLCNNIGVVRILLARGASRECRNRYNETALDIALIEPQNSIIVNLLSTPAG